MCSKIPLLKKCCFCIPRRAGLLVYVYFKLAYKIFFGVVAIYLFFKYPAKGYFGITISIAIMNAITIIVFIVGWHKKNITCMTWYYYYSIYWTALHTLLLVVISFYNPWILAQVPVFPAYFVFVLRSELIELEEKNKVQCEFVNKSNNSECTITIENENNGRQENGVDIVNVANGTENKHSHEEK